MQATRVIMVAGQTEKHAINVCLQFPSLWRRELAYLSAQLLTVSLCMLCIFGVTTRNLVHSRSQRWMCPIFSFCVCHSKESIAGYRGCYITANVFWYDRIIINPLIFLLAGDIFYFLNAMLAPKLHDSFGVLVYLPMWSYRVKFAIKRSFEK